MRVLNVDAECCVVRDETRQLLWGGEVGGPGDVKADAEMKWGSLHVSAASRYNKANEKISKC